MMTKAYIATYVHMVTDKSRTLKETDINKNSVHIFPHPDFVKIKTKISIFMIISIQMFHAKP